MRDEAIPGFNLLRIQDQLGLTQKDLAEAGEIDVGQFSHYISGEIFPRGETIYKIARVYGFNIDEFFTETDGPLKKAHYEPFSKDLFGKNLKRLLANAGTSTRQIAKRANMHVDAVYKLRDGKTQPHYMSILNLARVLEVSPSEFYK